MLGTHCASGGHDALPDSRARLEMQMMQRDVNGDSSRPKPGVMPRALPDWCELGARIRQAAFVATSLHLVHSAGGSLDDGAVLETPRGFAVG